MKTKRKNLRDPSTEDPRRGALGDRLRGGVRHPRLPSTKDTFFFQ